MQNIQIEITARRAKVLGSPVLICGNGCYTATFVFDEEWADVENKTARFVYNCEDKVLRQDVEFSGDTVAIPPVHNTRDVRVGVFAGDLTTTTAAYIPCEPSIRCGHSTPANPEDELRDKKLADLYVQWLLAVDEDHAYDFVNYTGLDLGPTNFTFSLWERSVTDEHTTVVYQDAHHGNNLLQSIYMPNATAIGSAAIMGTDILTKMTVGTLTSTTVSSFQQVPRGTGGAMTDIEIGEGTCADLYWQYSIQYTQECLHRAIERLADLTGLDSRIFQVGPENIAKIDEAHIEMLNQKNWNYY